MQAKNGKTYLEIAGLRLFCDYCFIKNIAKIRLPMLNAANYFEGQRRLQSFNQFTLFRVI